jgi:hypothetical protein
MRKSECKAKLPDAVECYLSVSDKNYASWTIWGKRNIQLELNVYGINTLPLYFLPVKISIYQSRFAGK